MRTSCDTIVLDVFFCAKQCKYLGKLCKPDHALLAQKRALTNSRYQQLKSSVTGQSHNVSVFISELQIAISSCDENCLRLFVTVSDEDNFYRTTILHLQNTIMTILSVCHLHLCTVSNYRNDHQSQTLIRRLGLYVDHSSLHDWQNFDG